MRFAQGFVVLVLLAALALVPRVASAQAGGISDFLSETITDLGTGGPVPIVVGPPPVFVTIPEGTAEPVVFVPMPPRQIDFIEGPGPTQGHLSDRLNISQYEVRIQSDSDPGGLAPRSGSIVIPASALESFQPIRIVASSDGDVTNTTQSDTLTITLGYYGPGTGTIVFSGVIPEPLPEGSPEPVLTVAIPPTFFDIVEPGSTQSIISDYVDILNTIAVRFESSDDLLTSPLTNGFITENFETGGGVRYSLDFVSDVDVPEPASCIVLTMGLLSLGLIGRRR